MNRKTLLQVIVLVLLLAGGGAYYFMQQGGATPDLSGAIDYVTGFFGEEKKPAPAATRRDDRMTAGPAAQSKAAPAAKAAPATIPSHPAQGQLHGQPFVVAASHFQNGALTLRQGAGPDDPEIVILLFAEKWQTPDGQKFTVDPKSAGSGVPHVHIGWKEGNKPERAVVTDKYTMQLEFGQEKNGKLPGKLYLVLPEGPRTQVAGTFDAAIRGFRLIDGKPDLSADAPETLEFLALRDILKGDPTKPVQDVYVRDTRLNNPDAPGQPMTGYLELEYRLGEGKPNVQRYQFVKEKDEWTIGKTLKPNQLDEAHPVKPVGKDEAPARLFTYLAAKRLESDVQKKHPKDGIYGAQFSSRFSDKYKLGVCEVGYRLAPEGNAQNVTYLFRLKNKTWVLDRPLKKNEKVDFDKGRISRG